MQRWWNIIVKVEVQLVVIYKTVASSYLKCFATFCICVKSFISSAGAEEPSCVHGSGRNHCSLCTGPEDPSGSVRVHRRPGQLVWRSRLVLLGSHYGEFLLTVLTIYGQFKFTAKSLSSLNYSHPSLLQVGQLRKLTRDTGVALILLITAKL